ncbi:MAG: hypothetical protein ACLQOO_17950 [Terriglobia bacterium]
MAEKAANWTLMREQDEQLSNAPEGDLLAGYREMAGDHEQEAEANEWCEGLIGDVIDQEGSPDPGPED